MAGWFCSRMEAMVVSLMHLFIVWKAALFSEVGENRASMETLIQWNLSWSLWKLGKETVTALVGKRSNVPLFTRKRISVSYWKLSIALERETDDEYRAPVVYRIQKMSLPVQHFFYIGCPGNVFFIRTTAVALTKLDAKSTKASFSSLAVASDQNENHVFYFESTTMKKGSNCSFSEKNCSQVTLLHLPCLHRGPLK